MERIGHIRDSSIPNTYEGETKPKREEIMQATEYDQKSEIRSEQKKVREYLDSFDEVLLKEVFAEYLRKSGSDEMTMNWIPFSQVRVLYSVEPEPGITNVKACEYSSKSGITIDARYNSSREDVLWNVIHEMCHAVSRGPDKTKYRDLTEQKAEYFVSFKNGFSETSVVKILNLDETDKVTSIEASPVVIKNTNINEGITELLTDRIISEYMSRTGTSSKENEETGLLQYLYVPYSKHWMTSRLYIGLISVLTGVERDTVEESIIRTYLRNGEILPEELQSELKNLNPKLSEYMADFINNEDQDDKLFKTKTFSEICNSPLLTDEQKNKLQAIQTEIEVEYWLAKERYDDLKNQS